MFTKITTDPKPVTQVMVSLHQQRQRQHSKVSLPPPYEPPPSYFQATTPPPPYSCSPSDLPPV